MLQLPAHYPRTVRINTDYLKELKSVSDFKTMATNEAHWRSSSQFKTVSTSTWQRAFMRKDDGRVSPNIFSRVVEYLCLIRKWDASYLDLCNPDDREILSLHGGHLLDPKKNAFQPHLWRADKLTLFRPDWNNASVMDSVVGSSLIQVRLWDSQESYLSE